MFAKPLILANCARKQPECTLSKVHFLMAVTGNFKTIGMIKVLGVKMIHAAICPCVDVTATETNAAIHFLFLISNSSLLTNLNKVGALPRKSMLMLCHAPP